MANNFGNEIIVEKKIYNLNLKINECILEDYIAE